MLKITKFICSSTILQLLIYIANEDKVDGNKSIDNGTRILSTFFMFKKLTKAGYLTFNAKRVIKPLKRVVKALKAPNT